MTNKDHNLIEDLLQKPCWVIDLLPRQVPEGSEGQFFAVEQLLLDGPRHIELRHGFARVLLMLNCYHDLVVFRGESECGKTNPKPEKLEKWITRNKEHLCIALPSEQALIVVPTDSTCLALHNPTPHLLDEVRAIASACGLFVWQPERP